jgi:hypothetical protein
MTRGDVTLWRIAKHTAAYAADDLTGNAAKAVFAPPSSGSTSSILDYSHQDTRGMLSAGSW